MAKNSGLDIEEARVYSNPENLILSEALLERLPAPVPEENCVLNFNENSFSAYSNFLEFEKDKVKLSASIPELKNILFVDANFPQSFFDKTISVEFLVEKITIVGKPQKISCEFVNKNSCIMDIELYNYKVEASNE